jgi:predicted alpha/beta hydrolase
MVIQKFNKNRFKKQGPGTESHHISLVVCKMSLVFQKMVSFGALSILLPSLSQVTIADHWPRRDQGGITTFLIQRFPGKPLVLVGHSVGAHIAPLNPCIQHVRRCLFIASNIGTKPKNFITMALFPLVVRFLSPLFGYFPASRIGLCEDIPSGVAKDWSRWMQYRDYCTIDEEPKRAYHQFQVDSYHICFSDDDFVYREGFEGWNRTFGHGRRPQMLFLNPKLDLKIDRAIRHMGFFFDVNRELLWDQVAPWLVDGHVTPFLLQQQIEAKL